MIPKINDKVICTPKSESIGYKKYENKIGYITDIDNKTITVKFSLSLKSIPRSVFTLEGFIKNFKIINDVKYILL